MELRMTVAQVRKAKKEWCVKNKHIEPLFALEIDEYDDITDLNINIWDSEDIEMLDTWTVASGTLEEMEKQYNKLLQEGVAVE